MLATAAPGGSKMVYSRIFDSEMCLRAFSAAVKDEIGRGKERYLRTLAFIIIILPLRLHFKLLGAA